MSCLSQTVGCLLYKSIGCVLIDILVICKHDVSNSYYHCFLSVLRKILRVLLNPYYFSLVSLLVAVVLLSYQNYLKAENFK